MNQRNMKRRIVYLDNAAPPQPDQAVVNTMLPWLRDHFGNPSSLHSFGLDAFRALENAREDCAELLDSKPERIIFTSSGSESNNLLIKGLLPDLKNKSVILTKLEHPSVMASARQPSRNGFDLLFVNNDNKGLVDLNHLEELLKNNDCGLLCVIHGSNEIGTVQDVAAIGRMVKKVSPDTWFHIDAVQSIGHIKVDPADFFASSITLSAHKIYGPRGAGILAMFREKDLAPLISGGGQENGFRSGTENTPAILGAIKALEQVTKNLSENETKMGRLRDLFAEKIKSDISGSLINGDLSAGLPHIISASYSGLLGEVLLHHLEEKGILASTGSACHSKWKDLSETLKAIGTPPEYAKCTIRFSLSKDTTENDIQYAFDVLSNRVKYLRKIGM